MALAIGEKAPDFTLKQKTDEDLISVTLSEHLGKRPIVLLFFPLAFTRVCTQELCTVSHDFEAYAKWDAVVYGISTDSPFSQHAWAKEHGITVPLLSDFNRKVAKAYGVLYLELLGFRGIMKRSAFVINKQGRIAYSWESTSPHRLPDFDTLKEALGSASQETVSV
tara:strand:- start:48811 stop:49308 length:498 start_codon:yes stop_codon:yes gene_type:complete